MNMFKKIKKQAIQLLSGSVGQVQEQQNQLDAGLAIAVIALQKIQHVVSTTEPATGSKTDRRQQLQDRPWATAP
jgi:hypothetical protein